MSTLDIGTTLGNFRIEALLGRGGMGEVYRGYDPRLERRVAIKIIRPEQRFSGVQKARFLREARLLSRLGHPAICQVYDLIESPEADYLVLEYIEGETLGELLRREALPLGRKLELAEKVALALAVAHRERVVHRDLKADNVMVTPAGEVKVLDFGIARSTAGEGIRLLGPPPLPGVEEEGGGLPSELAAGGGAPAEGTTQAEVGWARASAGALELETVGLTRHGVIVGSLHAMSPEQAAGGAVTTASDLYSLGVLLQQMLTGEPVYEARDEIERLGQIRRAEVRPLPAGAGYDPDLAGLLRDLQSLDPRRRPPAEEAAERLRLLLAKPQRLRRRRLRRIAIAAAFLVLTAGLAVVSWLALEADRARREAERRRRQAEGLIGFMLGDLRRRLERVNRLDVLDAVGDRALAYFGELPEGELTRPELVSRVEAVLQIGRVRYAQGNLGVALTAFRRADSLASQLQARVPGREAAAKLAEAKEWLGQTLYDLGRLDEALAVWSGSERQVRLQLQRLPRDRGWQAALATALHNVGTAYEARGDLDQALERYRESLALHRRLADLEPGDEGAQAVLAATLAFVSNVLERQGDLAGAERERRAHLAIQAALAAQDPGDPERRSDQAVAEGFLAGLLAVRGERAEALRRYQAGRAVVATLVDGDPDNALHQRWLGAFDSALGALLAEGGEGEARAAVPLLQRAGARFQALLAKDRENPDYRLQLGASRQRLAAALAGLDPRRALAAAREASAILAPLATAEAEEPTRGLIAAAEVTRGRLEAKAGHPQEARAAWERALALLAPCRRPLTHWKLLVPWTEAQLALGNRGAAAPALEQLRRMGYAGPGPRLPGAVVSSP